MRRRSAVFLCISTSLHGCAAFAPRDDTRDVPAAADPVRVSPSPSPAAPRSAVVTTAPSASAVLLATAAPATSDAEPRADANDLARETVFQAYARLIVGLPHRLLVPWDQVGRPPQATWTSSRPDIATIDANGILWPRSPGKVTITARVGGVRHQDTFDVKALDANVQPLERYALQQGVTADISAAFCDDDGSPVADWQCQKYELADGSRYVHDDGGCVASSSIETDDPSWDRALARFLEISGVPPRARALPLEALWRSAQAQTTTEIYPGRPELRVDVSAGTLFVIVPSKGTAYGLERRGDGYAISVGDWMD